MSERIEGEQADDLVTRARRAGNLLRRAGQRGLILFLTYRYERTRQRVQTVLAGLFAESELRPVVLDFRNEPPPSGDLVYYLLDSATTERDVMFVLGLDSLGVEGLRSLNFRRELLVEQRVKLVLWLTEAELQSVAREAPDFWAFNHRTIDFPEREEDEGIEGAYQAMVHFAQRTSYSSAEELQQMVATREAILSALPEDTISERADVLTSLGELYFDSGRYPEAERALRETVALSEGDIFSQTGARALIVLGSLARIQGRLEEAVQLNGRSLEINERLKNERGMAAALHNMGVLAQDQKRVEEARELYGRSLEIEEQLGNQRGIGQSLHQLGMLAHDQGRLDEARELYARSLEIAERLGDQQSVAYTLGQLGVLAVSQGRLEEARDYYERTQQISENLGDQSSFAVGLYQLGILAHLQGRYGEAGELYGRSMEIKERLGDQRGVANTVRVLGLLAEEEGDLLGAEEHFAQALETFRRLGSPYAEQAERDLARVRGKRAEGDPSTSSG